MSHAGVSLLPLVASATSRAVVGAALIGGAVLVLVVALMLVRKALLTRPEEPTSQFTLGDLRALRAQGRLTEQEFERARAIILRAYGKDPDLPPPGNASEPPPEPPESPPESPPE